MDRFTSLRALVAVADESGFAAAGRRLGLATSSVTRQIDALEARMGTALVNRSTHGVSLTDAGQDYVADARRILADLDAAETAIRERGGQATGALRVSVPIGFGRMFVAPMVPSFLAAHPGIALHLIASDRMVDLVGERIDVAIRLGRMPDSALKARRLANHRRVLVAAPGYLDAAGMPEAPEGLERHRAIAFDFGTGTHVWHLTRGDARRIVRVTPVLSATVSEMLVDAVTDGAGIAMMPLWLVADRLRAGRLLHVLPDWTAESGAGFGAIRAVTLPGRARAPAVGAFVDALAAHIGNPPVWER